MALFTSKADRDLPLLTKVYQAEAKVNLYEEDELGKLILSETKHYFEKFADRWSSWQNFLVWGQPHLQRVADFERLVVDFITILEAETVLNVKRALTPEEHQRISDNITALAFSSEKTVMPDYPEQMAYIEQHRKSLIYLDEQVPELKWGALARAEALGILVYEQHEAVCSLLDSLADSTPPRMDVLEMISSIDGRYAQGWRLLWSESEKYHLAPGIEPFNRWSPPTLFLELVSNAVIDAVIHSESVFRRCSECNNPYLVVRGGQVYCSHRCAHRVGSRRRYVAKPKENDAL